MPNDNVLQGVQCPACHADEPFDILGTANFLRVCDDGCSEFECLEWDCTSAIRCCSCGHSGIVAEFAPHEESKGDMIAKLNSIHDAVTRLLSTAQEFKERFKKDALNWANLHCSEVCQVLNAQGGTRYQVRIEECSPDAQELKKYIGEALVTEYGDHRDFEVITEW